MIRSRHKFPTQITRPTESANSKPRDNLFGKLVMYSVNTPVLWRIYWCKQSWLIFSLIVHWHSKSREISSAPVDYFDCCRVVSENEAKWWPIGWMGGINFIKYAHLNISLSESFNTLRKNGWPTFCRRRLQIKFLAWKIVVFWLNVHWNFLPVVH